MKRARRDGGLPMRPAAGFGFIVDDVAPMGAYTPQVIKQVSPMAGDGIIFCHRDFSIIASHIVERVKKNGIPVLGRNLVGPPILPFCSVPLKVSVVEEADGAKLAFIDPPQGPASDWEIKQA